MKRISIYFIAIFCFSLISGADDFAKLFVQNGKPVVLDESRARYGDSIFGSVFVDKNLDIYVGDMAEKNVKRYDRNGKLVTIYSNPGTGPGQFVTPSSAIVKDNWVIVNDITSDYFAIFDKDTGKFIKSEKKAAIVTLLRIDSQGNLYYAFSPKPDKDSICRMNDKFQTEKCFFRQDQLTGFSTDIHTLRLMDLDSSDNIYAGIRLSYKIAVFDKNFKLVRIFGDLGEQWNQFAEYEDGGIAAPEDWATISAKYTFLNNMYVLENKYVLQVKTAVKSKKIYYLDLYTLEGKKLFGEVRAERIFAGRDHLSNVYIYSAEKTPKGGTRHIITLYRLKEDIK